MDRKELINEVDNLPRFFEDIETSSYPSNDASKSIRKISTSSLSYRGAKELLEEVIEIAESFDYDILASILNSYRTMLEGIKRSLQNETRNFDFAIVGHVRIFEENKANWYDKILLQLLENRYKNLHNAQFQKSKELDKTLDKAELQINDLRETHTGLSQKIEAFDKRYSAAISKLENLYQQDKFITEAKRFQIKAYVWLAVSVIVGVGLVYFAYQFLVSSETQLNYENLAKIKNGCPTCVDNIFYFEVAKSLLFRILVVTLLVFVLTFFVRNYNAQMHNYTVNLHKSNSLYASGVLMNSAKTPDAQTALAVHAANAIFQQQPTGYNTKENNVLNSLVDKLRLPSSKD